MTDAHHSEWAVVRDALPALTRLEGRVGHKMSYCLWLILDLVFDGTGNTAPGAPQAVPRLPHGGRAATPVRAARAPLQARPPTPDSPPRKKLSWGIPTELLAKPLDLAC